MKRLLLFFCVLPCFLLNGAFAQQTNNKSWPVVKKEMRPWTRWWWMGSAVDEKNLDRLLPVYRQAGFGGLEVTPIYGAVGYEKRYIPFLSKEWMAMLDFTVKKAGSLGMGVAMNTGTGWPFGGPQVTKELASAKLVIQKYNITPGQKLPEKLVVLDTTQQRMGAALQAVTAYNDQGERLSLLDKVGKDGELNWSPASGNWTIYAAFSGKTAQLVKRAAPGGTGYVMDHYDSKAVNTYLARFDDAFQHKPIGVSSFFNDSYEVFMATWTPAFFQEFQKRRGYDLRLYLKEMESTASSDLVSRVKSDYRETFGELLLDNFTVNWNNWAHHNGALSKNQAHGSPGNLLDLYSMSDIPECEAFFGLSKFAIPGLRRDSTDIREKFEHNPNVFKFASSAAHFYGKPLVSSETFVWQTEHFKTSFSQCKPEVEQLFLSGINHVYFHGTTYSPQDVPWPGWLFYASANFVPSNSLWPHLNGMNDYITRCQSVLQTGKADNQLLVYWPVHDLWSDPKGLELRFGMHTVDQWLSSTPFNDCIAGLQKVGYSLDFVSDKMIGEITGNKALIIPATKQMPVETLEKIIRLANNGATIIFKSLPEDVSGFSGLEERRKQFNELLTGLAFTSADGLKQAVVGKGKILVAADVQQALEKNGIYREELTDLGLKYVRRDLEDGKYYYVVNHTAKAIDSYIPLNTDGRWAMIMDPQDGSAGTAKSTVSNGKIKVRVQMQPGEALFIRTGSAASPEKDSWKYLGKQGSAIAINSTWSLQFTAGGPTLPAARKLRQLVSWTALPDTAAVAFSGSGVYTTTFNLSSVSSAEYLLKLGEVDESAKIWINGKDAGIAWSFPFQKKIKKYLQVGNNTIKIEVTNLMANRVRDMDAKGIKWRNYHEINFVNFQYKPFDASVWKPMPSGLLGPVTIVPYQQAD
jgi:hypothetical protein